MKKILWCILILGSFWTSAAEAASRFEIKQMVMKEAMENEVVPVALALAVAKVESDFNAKALSSAGARGVMQIMPQTARGEFGVSAQKLWDAELNIELGIAFLEQLYTQYDGRWDLALSHYNGGTIKGNQPHSFTQTYLKRVQKWQRIYAEQGELWALYDAQEPKDFQEDPPEEDLWEEDRFVAWGAKDRFHITPRFDDFYEDETRLIIVERPRPKRGTQRGEHRAPPKARFHERSGPRRDGFY